MFELREYQRDSVDSLREGFKNNHKKQILSASTGSGKSVIATHLISEIEKKSKRCVFVCDRRILVDQFSSHLDKCNIDHGIIMAGHWRHKPNALVQVASIQTLEKMASWPIAEIYLIDEIHAVMRKSLIGIMNARPEMKVIGLTATPFHPELGNHFTSVTNVITMRELVDRNFLVPFRVFCATEIDTKGLKVTAGEWQKDELESRGLKVVGDIIADYVEIYTKVWGEPKKTIVFSSGVAHGTEIARRFSDIGLNFVQISYLDDDKYKEDVLKEFAMPNSSINGVISSEILQRGFDQPNVEHIILAKPLRKSFSMHVQQVGRGARIFGGKKFCVIQDNSSNWLRFASSWHNLYENGATELSNSEDQKTRKEPTDKEKEASKCPACGAVWAGNTDVCVHCGHVRVRRNDVIEVAGAMVELAAPVKEKFSSEFKEAFYQGLVFIGREKGFKDGWAYHKYIDKFSIAPAWKKVASPPSEDVRNWLTYQAIKYAKGNGAAQ